MIGQMLLITNWSVGRLVGRLKVSTLGLTSGMFLMNETGSIWAFPAGLGRRQKAVRNQYLLIYTKEA